MIRTYECRNRDCPHFAHRVIVRARPLDTLWEFPNVVCGCGHTPMIVGPPIIDGPIVLALPEQGDTV